MKKLICLFSFIILIYFIVNISTKKEIYINNILDLNDNWQGEEYDPKHKYPKPAYANQYMISTSSKKASNVGKEILEKGGNVIDAVIAAQMVLNVVEPQSSGIGGGAFLLYYDAKNKKTKYFNGRETAPLESNSEIFLEKNNKPKKFLYAVQGGLSVGTPSLLKMLKEVHKEYGKIDWEELFIPAIKIAEEGFPITERIYSLAKNTSYMKDHTVISKTYLDNSNQPKEVGTIIKNIELSKTFKTISKKGIKPFYEGEIGKNIVKTVRNSKINPGYLSMKDLKKYKVKQGDLICDFYRTKYKICSMPLPSSGGITLLQILGILESFDLSTIKPYSTTAIHLISEATRLAYADRNKYIEDDKNVPVKHMLDKNYLRLRSKLINKNKRIINVEAGSFKTNKVINNNMIEVPNTTHISVIDKEGNAITMTSSIEYIFGSALMVHGFLLNNQLTDFSFINKVNGKKVVNRLEPNKQPRSSMTPTFVFDNKDNLIMIIGSPGGPRIIQFVARAIISYIDWNIGIQESISLPNFVTLRNTIELEKGTFLEKLEMKLSKLGHKVKITTLNSSIQAITINKNTLIGGSDHRRNGLATGK